MFKPILERWYAGSLRCVLVGHDWIGAEHRSLACCARKKCRAQLRWDDIGIDSNALEAVFGQFMFARIAPDVWALLCVRCRTIVHNWTAGRDGKHMAPWLLPKDERSRAARDIGHRAHRCPIEPPYQFRVEGQISAADRTLALPRPSSVSLPSQSSSRYVREIMGSWVDDETVDEVTRENAREPLSGMLENMRAAYSAEMALSRAGLDLDEAVQQSGVSEADLSRMINELGSTVTALQHHLRTAQAMSPTTATVTNPPPVQPEDTQCEQCRQWYSGDTCPHHTTVQVGRREEAKEPVRVVRFRREK